MTGVRHRRERTAWTTAVVIGTTIVTVVFAFAAPDWGGPLFSGALFLQWPETDLPVAHDLPFPYRPVHQGHVDTPTGIYVREDEDVFLSETPPFVLRRSYTSGQHTSTDFGIGAMSNAVPHLAGDARGFQWAHLVQADRSRIYFDRLTPGKSYRNAVFGERGSQTPFWRSLLGWNGGEWVLRLRDGTVMWFLACVDGGGGACVLDRVRDSDGHVTRFIRNALGDLQTIDTGREQMTFVYDDQHRVVNVTAGFLSATYAYDKKGRLVRAVTSDAVREYAYDDADYLVALSEPGRSIENEFDGNGRLVRQVVHWPTRTTTERFEYRVQAGSVIEQRTIEDDGLVNTLRFNDARYTTFESFEMPGRKPIAVIYERSSEQFILSLSIRCTRDGEEVTTLVNEAPSGWDDAKDAAIASACDRF